MSKNCTGYQIQKIDYKIYEVFKPAVMNIKLAIFEVCIIIGLLSIFIIIIASNLRNIFFKAVILLFVSDSIINLINYVGRISSSNILRYSRVSIFYSYLF